jgi:hypothetical protein
MTDRLTNNILIMEKYMELFTEARCFVLGEEMACVTWLQTFMATV